MFLFHRLPPLKQPSVLVFLLAAAFFFILVSNNASAIPSVDFISESADVVTENGQKTLIVHAPDKYYNEDTQNWITANITDALNFTIVNGNLVMGWRDKYSVTFQPYIIYNKNTYTISQAKTLLRNKYPAADFTIEKEKQADKFKYGFNFSGVPAAVLANSTVFLDRIATKGLSMSDVKIDGTDILIKDKVMLKFDDLTNNNFTVNVTMNDITISNLHSGWLDPTLTISGTTTLCGNVTAYDTIIVQNGGTLAVCDYNGTANTGYVWLQNVANFTAYAGSTINANFKGYRGLTSGCEGPGCNSSVDDGNSGGGAGHGGAGGDAGYGGHGGKTYGSSSLYSTLGNISSAGNMNAGSGGGTACKGAAEATAGGDGGGLFIVSGTASGTIDIHGTVNGNGAAGSYADCSYYESDGSGGGSGGEFVFDANIINISGATINAKGGAEGGTSFETLGGAGGGGRIKFIYNTLSNTSTTQSVASGTCSQGAPYCTAQAGSIYYNSARNTAPTVIATATNQSQVFTNTDIPFNLTASDINAGDTLTTYVQVYLNNTKNGAVVSKVVTNSTNTQIMSYGSGNFSKHDSVIFEYWVGDAKINNTKANTSAIVVSNSLPALPSGWTNLGLHLTDHTPAISWTNGADADGDTIRTIVYAGTNSTPTAQDVNTTNEFTDLGNAVTLSDSTTYYYRLRAYDGEEYSASYTTSDDFRMNGLPTTSAPSIIPSSAYSDTSSLMCQNGTTSDPDNDTLTLTRNWYKNNVSLSINAQNLTNGNYTVNDQLICEIYVSDPYETNTTKLNSSAVIIGNYAPNINWNYTYLSDNSIDMTPSFGQTIKLNANITDTDYNIEGVWFTLTAPNGTKVINSVNGTRYNADLWNSSAFTINAYGSWQVNITANDTLGATVSQQWNFTVSLGTLSITPTYTTYSQKAGTSKLFNVTSSHDGNSNNTINITSYDYLSDSAYFTVGYSDALTGAVISNLTLQENTTYILTLNITSNNTLSSAQYISNITLGRTNDNSLTNFTVTTTISALVGDIDLTPTSWSLSMDSASTTNKTFTVTNLGDYALSSCNASVTSLSAYTTFNVSSFSVAVGSTAYLAVSISNAAAGTYSDTLTILCTATANGGVDTDTTDISASITQYTAPLSTVVSGGGGGSSELIINTVKSLFLLDNLDQYVNRYIGTITNAYRDEFRVVNKNPYDINVTLGFDCPYKPSFCDYVYFEDRSGQLRVKNVIASIRQKAGVNPGYTYITIAHNATTGLALGNYTYFITAKSADGTIIPATPMVVSVTDIAPTWVDVMADLLNNRIFISLSMILIVVLILFALIGKMRRVRARKQRKKDKEEGRLVITDVPN